MNLKKMIVNAFDILRLQKKVTEKVGKDKDAWKGGLLIVAIGSILSTLGNMLSPQDLGADSLGAFSFAPTMMDLIFSPLFGIVFSLIGIGIIFGLGKLFKGKGSYVNILGPALYLGLINWFDFFVFIPFLGAIIGIITTVWTVVVWIHILQVVQKLSLVRAILVIGIIILFFGLIAIIAVGSVVLMQSGAQQLF